MQKSLNHKSEKIQKILANAGFGSRREIELWLKAGRISVNGKVAKLGDRANFQDEIKLDDRLVKQEKSSSLVTRVLIYNKPPGEICARSDPEGRRTVFANLPFLKSGRWITVGRLDLNTSGLLLFTNNGELANKLMHPSTEIEREYAVRVLGEVDDAVIKNLKKGVALDDGPACFNRIKDMGDKGSNHWYHVVLKEGRNREVRRLWESQGVRVSRLMRIRFGGVKLPRGLRMGCWQELDRKGMISLSKI
jgi:23S rRNA pseudouridine2605 synthase